MGRPRLRSPRASAWGLLGKHCERVLRLPKTRPSQSHDTSHERPRRRFSLGALASNLLRPPVSWSDCLQAMKPVHPVEFPPRLNKTTPGQESPAGLNHMIWHTQALPPRQDRRMAKTSREFCSGAIPCGLNKRTSSSRMPTTSRDCSVIGLPGS